MATFLTLAARRSSIFWITSHACGANAVVVTVAEADTRVGAATEAKLVGRLDNRLVEVGSGPAQRDTLAGLPGMAADHLIARADTADMRKGRYLAHKLLGRCDREAWLLAHGGEVIGTCGQVGNRAGHGVDDRVPPVGEGDVHGARNLVASQRPALHVRSRKDADHVLAPVGQGHVDALRCAIC